MLVHICAPIRNSLHNNADTCWHKCSQIYEHKCAQNCNTSPLVMHKCAHMCAHLCTIMHKPIHNEQICTHKCALSCTCFAQYCTNVHNRAPVCTHVHKYAHMCTNLHIGFYRILCCLYCLLIYCFVAVFFFSSVDFHHTDPTLASPAVCYLLSNWTSSYYVHTCA